MAAERLLDGEADTLTRKAIELAKEGDTTALRQSVGAGLFLYSPPNRLTQLAPDTTGFAAIHLICLKTI